MGLNKPHNFHPPLNHQVRRNDSLRIRNPETNSVISIEEEISSKKIING